MKYSFGTFAGWKEMLASILASDVEMRRSTAVVN